MKQDLLQFVQEPTANLILVGVSKPQRQRVRIPVVSTIHDTGKGILVVRAISWQNSTLICEN